MNPSLPGFAHPGVRPVIPWAMALLFLACLLTANAADFFTINSVRLLTREPVDGIGVWKVRDKIVYGFLPCLEVKVTVREDVSSELVTARAYFFDQDNKLIAARQAPSPAGKETDKRRRPLPGFFHKGQQERFFFEVPEGSSDVKRWKAVVVFGDQHEAVSACYPAAESDHLLEYPEKKLVSASDRKDSQRKPAMDPLIEHVVETRNPKMPQITLFLRPPKGATDPAKVGGVLAVSALANSVADLKRELQRNEMGGDYQRLFSFANEHKLAVLAWGARKIWIRRTNYDELTREEAREADEQFDIVANAWERGVKELCLKYGIPERDFLLWGMSASSHWALRLCLRKPQYFRAIHIHIATNYDKPTPQAANVLWCVTTGELDAGYERSRRFYATCRGMGYPMIYKAYIGLGHEGFYGARDLGFEFFDFALRHRPQGSGRGASLVPPAPARLPPEILKLYTEPPFYGDIVNQDVLPADNADLIPPELRTALPTKEIAKAWQVSK